MKSLTSIAYKISTALMIVMLALSALPVTPAYAANTTTNSPSTNSNSSFNPAASSGNAYTSNNVWATATGGGQSADYATFGFGAIPLGATIDGIIVTIEGRRDVGSTRVWQVQFSNDGGANWTGAVQAPANANGANDSTVTVGAATANLGLATWTTDAQFRVRIQATNGGNTIYLDQLQVQIFYTVDGHERFLPRQCWNIRHRRQHYGQGHLQRECDCDWYAAANT
jgi:hypothetical protein